jgi:hypothetical protein
VEGVGFPQRPALQRGGGEVFSFERAADKASLNKDKASFANIERIDTPDASTVVLTLKNGDPDLLFKLGQATAVVVEPKSAANNATQPVGTGPYKLDHWAKGLGGDADPLARIPQCQGRGAASRDPAFHQRARGAGGRAAVG